MTFSFNPQLHILIFDSLRPRSYEDEITDDIVLKLRSPSTQDLLAKFLFASSMT